MKTNTFIGFVVFLIVPAVTLFLPVEQSTFGGYMLGVVVCFLAISLREEGRRRK